MMLWPKEENTMRIFRSNLARLALICLAAAGPSLAGSFELVVLFDSVNGSGPSGKLVQGINGNIWGTTCDGGASNVGTVYQVTEQGVLTTMHSFNTTDGACPFGGLILGANGTFYGTTPAGGAGSAGTIFNITPAGTFTTLDNFGASGETPHTGRSFRHQAVCSTEPPGAAASTPTASFSKLARRARTSKPWYRSFTRMAPIPTTASSRTRRATSTAPPGKAATAITVRA
jgi:uncharacterized repeat protein (TIGR03803 family)